MTDEVTIDPPEDGKSNVPVDQNPMTDSATDREYLTDVKENPGCKSTTEASKIECRPLGVKGKSTKKAKRPGNGKNKPSSTPKGEGTETPREEGKSQNRPLDVQQGAENKAITEASAPGKSGKRPSLPPLLIKQREYIHALMDPDSPTYGNQTKSYKAVYGAKNDNVAAVEGHRLVRSPKIQSWIEEALEKGGARVEDRVLSLAAIANNSTTPRKVRRQVIDKDGNKHTLVDRYEPTHSERIKAHDILNKLEGAYDVTRHAHKLAEQEHKALVNRFFKDKARTRKGERDVTNTSPDGPQDEGGVGGTDGGRA